MYLDLDRRPVPKLFESTREYAGVPEALEAAQMTYQEALIYDNLAALAAQWRKEEGRPARVLDLCSATGWATMRIAREIPVVCATLVDTDEGSLASGKAALRGLCDVYTYCEDAAAFSRRGPYDLVLMNSAYHHIAPNSKVTFLSKARSQLAPKGQILIGEHFLPRYSNADEFQQSVLQFYSALLTELENRGENETSLQVIRRAGLYCWHGDYEYKVSWEAFISHLTAADLRICQRFDLWRASACCPTSGSKVLSVKQRR